MALLQEHLARLYPYTFIQYQFGKEILVVVNRWETPAISSLKDFILKSY